MAEWLRRWTQDPIDNVYVGSNPTPGILLLYVYFFLGINNLHCVCNFATIIRLCITFENKFKSLFYICQDGRAVKALDLRSNRLCLRGFESHSWYFVVC